MSPTLFLRFSAFPVSFGIAAGWLSNDTSKLLLTLADTMRKPPSIKSTFLSEACEDKHDYGYISVLKELIAIKFREFKRGAMRKSPFKNVFF